MQYATVIYSLYVQFRAVTNATISPRSTAVPFCRAMSPGFESREDSGSPCEQEQLGRSSSNEIDVPVALVSVRRHYALFRTPCWRTQGSTSGTLKPIRPHESIFAQHIPPALLRGMRLVKLAHVGSENMTCSSEPPIDVMRKT